MTMQSILQRKRTLEATIAESQRLLEELEQSPELKREIAFETEARKLLRTYAKSVEDLVAILAPELKLVGGKKPKSAPSVKSADRGQLWSNYAYTNPHTGERVVVRSLNANPVVKWVREYGKETVLGWRVKVDDSAGAPTT
ncbi:transcriptional regulator [Pseudomonas sp. PDM21]|uniref:transcriptional regulator n=1 Tax=Pseudomonas sp. PDM21 TaxID=2769257 RepID=UPI00178429AF|nr:transcriptional regulator [Pseudomonas sp. PDM21]MBD9674930.1 transcriptional regulator [Pseudomonas sp. PDM21]